MLNERGGIECDFTVTRLARGPVPDRHRHGVRAARRRLDPPARAGRRLGRGHRRDVATRVSRRLGAGSRGAPAAADDVTSLANEAFPYMTAQELAVGPVPCLAVRVTYVGELGWELYCPAEFGSRLWDELWAAGARHGLVAGGYKAIDSLPPREGLPRLGCRHHPRGHALRGGARVRGRSPTRGRSSAATRSPRPSPSGCCAASSSPSPVRSRSARSPFVSARRSSAA